MLGGVPIAMRADDEIGLTLEVWDGEVPTGEVVGHLDGIGSGEAWFRYGRILTDLTTVTSPPGTDGLLAAAQFLDRHPGVPAKWAIVGGKLYWGALGFTDQVAGGPTTVVFDDAAVAATWLGLDPDPVRAALAEMRRELRRADSARN
jgi:hypothetical protein